MIEHSYLKKILDYNPETGIFIWKINKGNNQVKTGQIAGFKHHKGYWCIGIDGKPYQAHILAWFYIYGEWPNKQIDHKHNIKDDNRINELRLATQSQNSANRSKTKNNKSGYKGVRWHKQHKKWYAEIMKDYKRYFIGLFNDPIEAAKAYDKKALELFGKYAYLNFTNH